MSATHPLDLDFVAFQEAIAAEYSLERELGRGGMGIVYLAREVRLDRYVAIKLLPPALAARPGLRERFVREARTAAKLSRPHIVQIHRVDEVGAPDHPAGPVAPARRHRHRRFTHHGDRVGTRVERADQVPG
ncbi:MAG: hypothetical protein ABJD07_04135 [Gemmatimonadaceae bacterium]